MSEGTAATRAKNKYNEKTYDRALIVFKKGEKEIIKIHAQEQGESLNAFVNRAIMETMERDNITK